MNTDWKSDAHFCVLAAFIWPDDYLAAMGRPREGFNFSEGVLELRMRCRYEGHRRLNLSK